MGSKDQKYRNKIQSWNIIQRKNQKVLDFITIDMLKLDQKNTSSQDIITLPMTPIINSSFNKHPMSRELIHLHLLHPYDSVMKEICSHQTLEGPPKRCLKKINKSSCKIWYTAKMTTTNKGKTVDISNLQTRELIHMDFAFYKRNLHLFFHLHAHSFLCKE